MVYLLLQVNWLITIVLLIVSNHRFRRANPIIDFQQDLNILILLIYLQANQEMISIYFLVKKVVVDFFEKQPNPPGNIANGAVYVFEDDFLYWMIKNFPKAKDFSTDIIPKLLGKIYTYHTNMPYIDIGTPKSLDEAKRIAKMNEVKT